MIGTQKTYCRTNSTRQKSTQTSWKVIMYTQSLISALDQATFVTLAPQVQRLGPTAKGSEGGVILTSQVGHLPWLPPGHICETLLSGGRPPRHHFSPSIKFMAIGAAQQAIEAPLAMPIQALKTIVVTGANRAIELEVSAGPGWL